MARPLAAVLAALAVMLAAPGSAVAHAVLTHTTPHQGSSVDTAPSAVQFDFNEPVEVSFGAVRVFDSSGKRVDRGDVSHPGGKQSSVSVGVRGGLGRGIYTGDLPRHLSRRASGLRRLLVRRRRTRRSRQGPRRPRRGQALGPHRTPGPVTEGAYGVVRGLHYAALLLVVGALFFRAVRLARRDTERGGPGACWRSRQLWGWSHRWQASPCRARSAPASRFFDALDSKVLDGTLVNPHRRGVAAARLRLVRGWIGPAR